MDIQPKDLNDKKPIVKRIGGYLHKVIPMKDSSGKIINYVLKPFMVEFRFRDLLQVIVGAAILAIPLAFTEETWVLGEVLPLINVLILAVISLILIAVFVYFNFYRYNFNNHKQEYIKRVLLTYLSSLIVVGLVLTVIEKCPWGTDNLLAFKRIIIVSFPASMSATISDVIK